LNEGASWRLILDDAAPGAWNMAVDESLLNRYACASSPLPPTLRLYGFAPAALSLGRFQDARSAHRPEFLREHGIGLVRRPSGGSAVLHDRERTYSIVGLLRENPFGGGVVETYRRIAEALVIALVDVGANPRIEPAAPPNRKSTAGGEVACFGVVSSHEITSGGRKLVGSAQLRRRGAFLQHGSIPLRSDAGHFARASGIASPAGSATDLETAAGTAVAAERLDASLLAAFETRFQARLVPGGLTAEERIDATRLYSWKYCSTAWTHEGRIGRREAGRCQRARRPGSSHSTRA